MSQFHNPYHFVPADTAPGGLVPKSEFDPPERGDDARGREHPHLAHDRFVAGTHTGRITCRVTVETPLICGNRQQEREGWTKLLRPFSLDGGVTPALPGSALRGMVSAIMEAASASSLRVLADSPLSHRMAAEKESLSALGMLVSVSRPDGTTELRLQPLTVPTVANPFVRNSQCGNDEFPEEYTRMFQVAFGQPLLRAYVDGYQPQRGQPPSVAVNAGSFIGTKNPVSYSADHQEFWYARLAGTVALANRRQVQATHGRRDSRCNRFLLAQELTGIPISQSEYDALPPADQATYTRGILRVLGITGRESEMPTGKKHESFIPYPAGCETSIPTFPVADALDRFHRLADQRTEADPELPFEVKGSKRNDNPGPYNRNLRLRAGDLVFFRPDRDNPGIVAEVAVSSIWRAGNGSVHEYFADLSPHLLPLDGRRDNLTRAEQLLGTVEVRDSNKKYKNPAFALASRLRFGHAVLIPGQGHAPWQAVDELLSEAQRAKCVDQQLNDYPLKNLASPKPPSPALYFKSRGGAPAYVAKKELKVGRHAPQGRKFYLRRDPSTFDPATAFVHPDRFPADCDSIARQHQSVERLVRTGTVFHFAIDFTNLTDLELQLLAYCLSPSDSFRHQLGHGKPLGLGQVHLETVSVRTICPQNRYCTDDLNSDRWHHNHGAAALAEAWREWASRKGMGSILESLELLGSPPAGNLPIHYPHIQGVLANSREFECKLFQWFMQNDETAGNRAPGQFLCPLVNEQGQILRALPKLERTQQNVPPAAIYQDAIRQVETPVGHPDQLRGKVVDAVAQPVVKDGRVPFSITHAGKSFSQLFGYFEIGKFDRSNFAKKHPEGTAVRAVVINVQGDQCTLRPTP